MIGALAELCIVVACFWHDLGMISAAPRHDR